MAHLPAPKGGRLAFVHPSVLPPENLPDALVSEGVAGPPSPVPTSGDQPGGPMPFAMPRLGHSIGAPLAKVHETSLDQAELTLIWRYVTAFNGWSPPPARQIGCCHAAHAEATQGRDDHRWEASCYGALECTIRAPLAGNDQHQLFLMLACVARPTAERDGHGPKPVRRAA